MYVLTLNFFLKGFDPPILLLFSRKVMSDSLRPHGVQSARLLCPWDFPGKNTGVGCHFLLQSAFNIYMQLETCKVFSHKMILMPAIVPVLFKTRGEGKEEGKKVPQVTLSFELCFNHL